uniref:Dynein light chain n=1 Tax=Steinernema glaseri TaxID=37863 RepID=A0A1I7YCF1_9BILA
MSRTTASDLEVLSPEEVKKEKADVGAISGELEKKEKPSFFIRDHNGRMNLTGHSDFMKAVQRNPALRRCETGLYVECFVDQC